MKYSKIVNKETKEECYNLKTLKLKPCKNPKLTLSETFAKWELERLGLKPKKLIPIPHDGTAGIPDFVCGNKYIEVKDCVNKQFLKWQELNEQGKKVYLFFINSSLLILERAPEKVDYEIYEVKIKLKKINPKALLDDS